MSTVQAVLDRSRVPLNDADKVRHSDATLLTYLNDGLAEIRALRPDLRLGSFTVATPDVALGDTFPLPRSFESVAQYYITGRAEMIDDEHATSGRAVAFGKMFAERVGAV